MILAKVLRESENQIEEMIYIEGCSSKGNGSTS